MEPDTPFDVNVYVPAAACCPNVIVIAACAEFVPVKLTDPWNLAGDARRRAVATKPDATREPSERRYRQRICPRAGEVERLGRGKNRNGEVLNCLGQRTPTAAAASR
jgi:hypothetical protein